MLLRRNSRSERDWRSARASPRQMGLRVIALRGRVPQIPRQRQWSGQTSVGRGTAWGRMLSVGQPKDIRLSFDNAAEIYDDARPSYPPELFDELFNLLPTKPQLVEVGPGTGKATKDLLARGASVHAIEIGPAMAARLLSNLPSERLRVSVGDFENMDIDPGADAVFSATAYHWITPAAQSDRPATILRLGGLVAIVDLIQVESPDDLGFFASVQPIYERYGQGHSGPAAPTRNAVDPAIRSVLDADSRFGPASVHRWDWNQTYTASGC